VGQRHADAPAIWAVSLAVLVNEIVQRDGHGRLHSAQKRTFYDTAMNLDLQFAAGYLDARADIRTHRRTRQNGRHCGLLGELTGAAVSLSVANSF
jgi:hypothetical protein